MQRAQTFFDLKLFSLSKQTAIQYRLSEVKTVNTPGSKPVHCENKQKVTEIKRGGESKRERETIGLQNKIISLSRCVRVCVGEDMRVLRVSTLR